jgi:hypothetical protein
MLKGFGRVLQRLPGMFVPCLVILFAVMRSRHPVRMCSQIVKLSSSLMCILRHKCSFPYVSLLREHRRAIGRRPAIAFTYLFHPCSPNSHGDTHH